MCPERDEPGPRPAAARPLRASRTRLLVVTAAHEAIQLAHALTLLPIWFDRPAQRLERHVLLALVALAPFAYAALYRLRTTAAVRVALDRVLPAVAVSAAALAVVRAATDPWARSRDLLFDGPRTTSVFVVDPLFGVLLDLLLFGFGAAAATGRAPWRRVGYLAPLVVCGTLWLVLSQLTPPVFAG